MRTRARLAILAVAGMLLGHLLAYFVAAPDPHHRAHLLEITGHGRPGLIVVIGLACLFGAVAMAVGDAITRSSRRSSYGATWARLAAAQLVGFTALEAVERAISGEIAGLMLEPVFLGGLLVQVVVAGLAAIAILAIQKIVTRFVSPLEAECSDGAPLLHTATPSVLPRAFRRAVWQLRGPPAPQLQTI